MGVSLKDSFQCRSPRDICSRPSDGGGAPLTERRDCNHGLTSRLARLYRNLYVTKLFPAVTQCPIEVPSMSTLYCCITRALKSLTLHVNGLRNQHCSTLHVGYLRFRTVQEKQLVHPNKLVSRVGNKFLQIYKVVAFELFKPVPPYAHANSLFSEISKTMGK